MNHTLKHLTLKYLRALPLLLAVLSLLPASVQAQAVKIPGTSADLTHNGSPLSAVIDSKSSFADRLIAWDNFARSSGSLGTAPTGQTYLPSGASLPVISNGKMIVPLPDVTGYAQLDAGATPREIWMKFVLAPASSASGGAPGMTLICTNDTAIQLANLVHLSTTDKAWALQKRIAGGAFVPMGGGSYTSTLAGDGTTEYTLGMEIEGSTAKLSLPDGSFATVTDPDIQALAGPRVIFEPTWLTGGKQPKVTRIGIVKTDSTLPRAPYPLRSDISSYLAPLQFAFDPRRLITITPTTAGWYRIISSSGYSMTADLEIVGNLDANSQETNVKCSVAVSGFGQGSAIVQTAASGTNLGQVDQVRVSSDGSSTQYVDLHISASSLPVLVYVLAGKLPSLVASPVVGAAAGSTDVKTLALSGTGLAVTSPMTVGGVQILSGAGAPTVAASNGAVYFRTDGSGATTLYLRVSGAWVAVGGSSLPSGTDGQTLRYNGTSLVATSGLTVDGSGNATASGSVTAGTLNSTYLYATEAHALFYKNSTATGQLDGQEPNTSWIFRSSTPSYVGWAYRDAAGQTADISQWQASDGTPFASISASGVVKASGYKSSDGTAGATEDVTISGTVLHFKNGIYTGHS